MKVDIRTRETDDELPFRSLALSFGSTSITTPVKACDRSIPVSQVNEIHRDFKVEQLDRVLSDEGYERRTNSEIRRKMGEGLNLFLVDISDTVDPGVERLEALSDIQYENSDVVVTPLWSSLPKQLTGQALLDRHLELTDAYLDIVETLNNKTIVGSISSRIPRQLLARIIDRYHERGVTAYLIDFDGRSVMTNPSWIRSLVRLIAEIGTMDETFLYSVNAGEGKFLKNADRVLARDFMGTGFGLDILGLNHIRPRLSSEQWKKIKKARSKNLLRLFDRSDYSYYRLTEPELMEMWRVPAAKLYARRKAHNIQEQLDETIELHGRLREEASLETYLQTKDQIDEGLLKKMRSLKRAAHEGESSRQDTLF